MLTAKARRNLVSNWNRIPPGQLKIYHRRLRIQAMRALMDLALIAEREKEDQLEQIFTPQTITPLLNALIGRGCEEIVTRHYDIAKQMLFISFEKLRQRIYATSHAGSGFQTSIQKDIWILMKVTPPENRKVALHDLKGTRASAERERQAILKRYLKKQYRHP